MPKKKPNPLALLTLRIPRVTKQRFHMLNEANRNLKNAVRAAIILTVDDHFCDLDPTAERVDPLKFV